MWGTLPARSLATGAKRALACKQARSWADCHHKPLDDLDGIFPKRTHSPGQALTFKSRRRMAGTGRKQTLVGRACAPLRAHAGGTAAQPWLLAAVAAASRSRLTGLR